MNVEKKPSPLLSERFKDALLYASSLHERQLRKGTDIPYIAHLLGVTSLVLEDGGDEDLAIGALLHDAVEDQGGRQTLEAIYERYGDRVGRIVEGCTDAFDEPKPAWNRRKEAYIDHLRGEAEDVIRVSLADKLYNARALLLCYRQIGEKTWERFNGGKEGTLWYYQTLVKVFREIYHSEYVNELDRTIKTLIDIVDNSVE